MFGRYEKKIKLEKRVKNLFVGLFALFLIVFGGSALFSTIEKKSFYSSLYYVFLSITTVGAPREFLPSTSVGKALGVFIILAGMGITLYIAMQFAIAVIEGEIVSIFIVIKGGLKKMKRLKNHVIVCGYGKFGKYVCAALREEKQPYVIIEKDEAKVSDLIKNGEFVVTGNALDPRLLREAGIERAKALVATLPDDAENLYLIMTAKDIREDLIFAARAVNEEAIRRLHKVGAQIVVLPESVSGKRLAKSILEFKK